MKNRPFRFPHLLTDILLGASLSLFILWTGTKGFEAIQSAKYDLFLFLFGGYLALMLLFSVELLAVRRRLAAVRCFVIAYKLSSDSVCAHRPGCSGWCGQCSNGRRTKS